MGTWPSWPFASRGQFRLQLLQGRSEGFLKPSHRVALATELDWSVLTARSIALIDIVGERHPLRHGELVRLRRQLHQMLQGSPPRSTSSARDWLYGSANLAFGMVILGLGLFMLLWVIATG